MTLSPNAKSRTLSNGTTNDAAPVEANFVELFQNDADIADVVNDLTDNAIAVDGQKTFNDGIATDTISEKTAATGVTADGVRLKDGMAKVSGTPTEGGEIGYDDEDNELLFHDGTEEKYIPASNAAMPIDLTSPAEGDILQFDGTNWVNIAGKIVQVVGSSVISGSSSSSTSMADVTGASLSITPTNASNKVLILASWQFAAPLVANENVNGYHQILRAATNISGADAFKSGADSGVGGSRNYGSHSFTYLDSPATTSATTYKLQHRTTNASGAIATSRVTFVLVEISA